MKRHVLKTDAVLIVDNRSTGVRQTVKIQVLTAGTIFISTQQNDLQQLDATGAPVNGTRLTQASSIQDGTYVDFLGQLWMRSDVGADVDVTITNSPPQGPVPPRQPQTNTPWNAPRFGSNF